MSDSMRCNQISDSDKDMDSKPIDSYTFLEAYNEADSAKDRLPTKYEIKNTLENVRKNFQDIAARMTDRTIPLSDQKGITSLDEEIGTLFNRTTTSCNPSVSASFVKNKDEPLCSLCKNADICKYREKFETLHKHVMEWYDKEFKDIDPNHELFNIIISCQHFNMMHSGVRNPLQY